MDVISRRDECLAIVIAKATELSDACVEAEHAGEDIGFASRTFNELSSSLRDVLELEKQIGYPADTGAMSVELRSHITACEHACRLYSNAIGLDQSVYHFSHASSSTFPQETKRQIKEALKASTLILAAEVKKLSEVTV